MSIDSANTHLTTINNAIPEIRQASADVTVALPVLQAEILNIKTAVELITLPIKEAQDTMIASASDIKQSVEQTIGRMDTSVGQQLAEITQTLSLLRLTMENSSGSRFQEPVSRNGPLVSLKNSL